MYIHVAYSMHTVQPEFLAGCKILCNQPKHKKMIAKMCIPVGLVQISMSSIQKLHIHVGKSQNINMFIWESKHKIHASR